MTLETAAPIVRFDDLDLSRCVFAGDVVAHLGDEVTLYLRDGLKLRAFGSFPTAAEAFAALDIFDAPTTR